MYQIIKKSVSLFLQLSLILGVVVTMETAEAADKISLPGGLSYTDSKVGTGKEALSMKKVVVHYTGWLNKAGEKGTKFDSSKDRAEPFEFHLGGGEVIKGWDEGVKGMKVGGARTLYIPSQMGYGARGAGGVIPPNADLIFDVELLDVK